MQTVRHGRVLGIAGLLIAGTPAQAHRRTTAIGRRLRRQMVAAATRMAGTRTGIPHISRQRARVLHQEIIGRHTRMLRHTTIRPTTAVEAAARMRHLPAPLPHRAAVILRRRARIRRQAGIIQLHRVRIPHQRAAVIPRRAIATVAEAATVEEAGVAVEAEEAHRAVEAVREVAEARTETARTDTNVFAHSPPQKFGAGFFCGWKIAEAPFPLQLFGAPGVYYE
jgi:hypothetical protein